MPSLPIARSSPAIPATPTHGSRSAICSYNANQLDEAITSLQKSLELKPDQAEAEFNLARAYQDQQKFPEAIAAYQKGLALKPKDAHALYNLGNAYMSQKDPKQAAD